MGSTRGACGRRAQLQPEGFWKPGDKYQVCKQTHKRLVHLVGNRGKGLISRGNILGPYSERCIQLRQFRKEGQKTIYIW